MIGNQRMVRDLRSTTRKALPSHGTVVVEGQVIPFKTIDIGPGGMSALLVKQLQAGLHYRVDVPLFVSGTVSIKTGWESDWVWVEIADDGEEIAAQNLTRIFDPFLPPSPSAKGPVSNCFFPAISSPNIADVLTSQAKWGKARDLRSICQLMDVSKTDNHCPIATGNASALLT